MLTTKRKNKDLKFHKVETKNFKNAKKINKYRSSKQVISFENHFPNNNNKNKKGSFQSSSINNLIKNIEEKYMINKNQNIVEGRLKRNHSLNKLNIFKFKDLLSAKNFKPEEEKNNGMQDTSADIKIRKKDEKKKINKKAIKHCKSLHINKYNQFNILKDIKNFNNIQECDDTKSCNNVKDKKRKKDVKPKKSKIFIKEEKKTNDESHDRDKNENYVSNNKKFRFLCCFHS